MANSQSGFGASYTSGTGSFSLNELAPIVASRAPTTSDSKFPIGKIWSYPASSLAYILVSKSSSSGGVVSATWDSFAGGTSSVDTITGDSGGALSPTSGNINILGTASQITTTGSGSTLTLSLPSAIAITTSVTSASFITSSATLGTTFTANSLTPTGSDTNIDLLVNGKGTGGVIHSRGLSGGDVTIEVTNTNNVSGSSRAGFEAAVGGASAGDPYINFLVSGAGQFTMGIDNSASDTFVLSSGAALGTNNLLTITSNGTTSFLSTNVSVSGSNAGSFSRIFVENTSAAASSDAVFNAVVADAAAGDAFSSYSVTGGASWSFGIDNSVSDNFVFAASATLGTSNAVSITTDGAVTTTSSITATAGNITASNGNLVASTAATGLSLPVATGTGAAAGAVTCTGRVGSVTFSSVSVAAAADITLTMTNTSIAGASTRLVWSMSGATTGAALTVKSFTPSASQAVWVVTNGTGATTSTANIVFDFIVLN